MRRVMAPWAALPAILALLAAVLPAPALAQGPEPLLALELPAEAAVGAEVQVAALLLDPAGNPIRGETVAFSMEVVFQNTRDAVSIGRARTDDEGRAVLRYVPKSEGERRLTASFRGSQVFRPTSASGTLLVAPGGPTYQQESPFRIPGANVYLMAFILTVVWSIYAVVAFLFVLVGREGAKAEAEELETGVER